MKTRKIAHQERAELLKPSITFIGARYCVFDYP